MILKTKPLHLVLCLALVLPALAQDELDGPTHIFKDDLLNKMVGTWQLSGTIMRRPVKHTVDAEWVLNHQFLRIHEKDVADAVPGEVRYEAMVMVGYDNTSDRYVAHWMDIYGGRFSETLGYGKRSADQIEFIFEYPDGPFHTTFRWKPEQQQWQWLMRGKNKEGQWYEFGDMMLARATKP